MSIVEIGKTIALFIDAHYQWGWLLIMVLSCLESLALVSLFFPATLILVTFSSVLSQSQLSFYIFWLAAVMGAFLGDAISYWIGYRFKDKLFEWPFLKKYHKLQQKGMRFFMRWGFLGVFIGRFFGPLRAILPLIAGICGMNPLLFQLANLLSAILWGFMVLAPGALAIPCLIHFLD